MPKRYQGIIVRGLGRGRSLGFPTANIQLPAGSPPPREGVWAAWARLDGDPVWRQAAAHVGPRPTIAGAQATIELHVLDLPDEDLYGRTLAFELHRPLRSIEKFATLKELQAAIHTDCEQARQLLLNPPLNE